MSGAQPPALRWHVCQDPGRAEGSPARADQRPARRARPPRRRPPAASPAAPQRSPLRAARPRRAHPPSPPTLVHLAQAHARQSQWVAAVPPALTHGPTAQPCVRLGSELREAEQEANSFALGQLLSHDHHQGSWSYPMTSESSRLTMGEQTTASS